ncbi:MAG: helix-turn-helix transcriptional regulator [Cyanobacteria bacterium P01_F01_bin.4]
MTTLLSDTFSELLKYWRKQRNLSQLTLSLNSDVSQRHISFLESGRAKPSREMVLQLATVLDIPFREQNKLLTAAGFAPVFTESDLSAPELAPIRKALDFMLTQQEPFPAIVMDRYWNQIDSNQAAQRVMTLLLNADGMQACMDVDGRFNLMKATLHPAALRPTITNWDDIASHLIRRVHRETLEVGQSPASVKLFDELMSYPDVPRLWETNPHQGWHMPMLTVNFKKDEQRLSFFSTIATLGTPHDITLQELRIESMFPADEGTAARLKKMMSTQFDIS